MGNQALIGMAMIATLVVSGMLIVRVLAMLVYPLREQLFEDATKLLHSGVTSQQEKRLLNYYMDHAMSFSAGWDVLQAMWVVFKQSASGQKPRSDPDRSRKISGVGQRFIVSALVANPVALMLAIPMMAAVMIIEREPAKPAFKHTAAQLSVSHQMAC